MSSEELDRIVFAYLKEKGYSSSLGALKRESRVRNLEDLLETRDDAIDVSLNTRVAAVAHRDKPEDIAEAYTSLNSWIAASLDQFKNELYAVTYPIFVHCYLELLYKGHDNAAARFFADHHLEHVQYHRREIEELSGVRTLEKIDESDVVRHFRTSKYHLKLCNYSFELLFSFVLERKYTILQRIINQRLNIDIVPGKPSQRIEVGMGFGFGAGAMDEVNKSRVYWGTYQLVDEPEDVESKAADGAAGGAAADTETEAKKRKRRQPDHVMAPPEELRVKIPAIRGQELAIRQSLLRDARMRVALGPKALPSCCAYTLFNVTSVTCMSFSDDCSMLAAGADDSLVRVVSLTERDLKSVFAGQKLEKMNIAADSRLEDFEDDATARKVQVLRGHSGPVYATSFCPSNLLLLSSSEDKTVRLWSLTTYTNVACYRGHNYPVWHVEFSPLGHYFASASHDRTARLWSTEKIFPQRVFAGHLSDVDCVKFHPNGNYLATGSTDKSCRLWDVQTGECVRIFLGHRDTVHVLAFTHDGRFMASGSDDWSIMLWDVSVGRRIKTLNGHFDVVYSLDFSGEDALLASGGADHTVRLWDCKVLQEAALATLDEAPLAAEDEDNIEPGETSPEQLTSLQTKNTPVHAVRFGATNYLLAAGIFLARPEDH